MLWLCCLRAVHVDEQQGALGGRQGQAVDLRTPANPGDQMILQQRTAGTLLFSCLHLLTKRRAVQMT